MTEFTRLVNDYTEMSKEELFKHKEIREFDDYVNREISRVVNVKFNTSTIKKITHPITMMKVNRDHRNIKKVRRQFDYYIDSSVMYYNQDDFADTRKDLAAAAKNHKPAFIKKYIKSVDYRPISKNKTYIL